MKPRIFIGSSKESVKIAEKVKSLLDGEYVCQLWCDNFFDLGQCTYHELLKKSLSFDYAIFIGGKDDYVRRESDRTHKYAARDNVYLEFGLYAGILTYARCFFLIQEGCQIASDLLGVNVVFFDKMQDLSKKILTITEKIQKEQKVARISLLPSTSLAVGYFENFLKPVSQAIQKLDEVCIAGKKYDVKNSDKRLEVAIPAKVSEDLRMWSEYVYENHAVEKVTVDSSIRKIGVNIDYHQETVTYLGQQGWDFAFGGEIGEEKDAYIEMLKSTVKQYEESTGKIAGAYFFNGKEYGRGSKILYPNFKEMDFKIGVAFAKDASSLKHGKNTDYNMEIEECQNISMREDMETIENILDQVIEARSVVVLSDFSLERQMEIAGEASLEHFEEILDLLLQKQSESDLVVGSVTCYEGTLEDRANRIEQRRQKYSEYEQKCLEEIEQLTKQRDEALEKQEVKK